MSDHPLPASPTRVPEAQPHGRALVAVPRMWLVALTALVVVPWLVVAGVRMWPDAEDAIAVVAPGDISTASMPVKASGRWGELVVTPITISPPIEYVSRQWGELQASVWHFPPLTGDELETRLVSYGISREDAVRLRGTARSASIGGVFVVPDAALVARLSPEVRGRLYLDLGKIAVSAGPDAPINFDQVSSYRFRGDSIDSWLGGPGLSAETHALVEPYIYQQNGFLYFADIEQVRSRIPNADELQLLAKRLLRHATMLVQLRIPDTAQIAAIAEYWGRGGRRTDLQPLLESVARSSGGQSGGMIDISHLLPTMARNHLYRYPRPSVEDLQRPLLANCLWTALNFFAPVPDARYLDPPTALAALKTDYYLVQDNFQLGDVVAFTDAKGELVHVAVYIAGDLLFSKNGTSALAPWSILPLEYLKGHYVEHADDWRITYHRRNDM